MKLQELCGLDCWSDKDTHIPSGYVPDDDGLFISQYPKKKIHIELALHKSTYIEYSTLFVPPDISNVKR